MDVGELYPSIVMMCWSISQVFVSEFKLYDRDYYTGALEAGKITINGESVAATHVLR